MERVLSECKYGITCALCIREWIGFLNQHNIISTQLLILSLACSVVILLLQNSRDCRNCRTYSRLFFQVKDTRCDDSLLIFWKRHPKEDTVKFELYQELEKSVGCV